MRVLVCNDAAAAAARGAALIGETLRAALNERGCASCALSGGRTPWPMLQALAKEPVPWNDVHLFQTDERVAPAGDKDRSLTHLTEALLVCVPLAQDHVHPMPVEATDLAAAAHDYAATLAQVAGAPPVLDLVHLGLGVDGHTASLVPGDPALGCTDADVTLAGPYQGHRRMTLTFPMLNRARALLWLVTGSGKADALRRLCASDPTIPAGRVNLERAIILADRAAAAAISIQTSQADGRENV